MLILNLCDINDDAENIYYTELLKYFTESQVFSREVDYSAHPGELILALMRQKYDLIIGHGFGGLIALVIGRMTGAKTILINPMYPASRYWDEFYPDYKFKSFMEYITENDICWDTYGETTRNVFLILGKDDDLIDTATTDKYLTEGNSFYVEGGHWPEGEDFVLKFGELTGGLIPTGDGNYEKFDGKEEQAYSALNEFIQQNAEYRLMYLYTFIDDTAMLTTISKRYMHSLEESENLKGQYITADSLPTEENAVRDHFKNVDYLVIDKIVEIVLSDETRRSLWIACDEVISHGGRVLLLSDSHAADLFDKDESIMDLIYTGIIKQICFYGFKPGLRISFDSRRSDDVRAYEDRNHTVIIDGIRTKYGNIAIRWHEPEKDSCILYVYYKDDQWFYDSSDGWCDDTQAKAVLCAAIDQFVDEAKDTDHDAKHFFGWGW